MPKPVLLIVDMLNHFRFSGGDALAARALAASGPIRALRDRFDDAGDPVIYANDNWTDWRGEFQDLVAACRAAGGPSAVLADKLRPTRAHYHVLKPERSALQFSALPVLLNQLGVDRLVLTGIATDACILATASDGKVRQYKLWIPEDCSAAETAEQHAAALRIARHSLEAETRPTDQVRGTFPAD